MVRLILCVLLAHMIVPGSQSLSFDDVGKEAVGRAHNRALNFLSRSSKGGHRGAQHRIRVACAGGSIVSGYMEKGDRYPVFLQQLLGDDYDVANLGCVGKVVQKVDLMDWPSSYWRTEQFSKLMMPQWDIVVLTLGTSDAKDPPYWNHTACDQDEVSASCKFWADYDDLIKAVQKSGSPEIFITVPPPVTKPDPYGINAAVVNSIFPKLIPKLAKKNGISSDHVIDLFTGMGGDSVDDVPEGRCTPEVEKPTVCKYFCDEEFCDHVHPIETGKRQIAKLVAKAIQTKSNTKQASASH